MAWKNFKLSSTTGAQLNVHADFPRKPHAVVQINHGLAEYGARYEEFAEFLRSRNYAAVVHDHRGHGQTTAPDARPGVFAARDGLAKAIADMAAVNAHIAGSHRAVPIILFGHSMGAILAMNYVLAHPETVSGCAVWNANIQSSVPLSILARIVKLERMMKGSDVPSTFARRAVFDAWNAEFKPTRTAFDWLSRDEAEVDKYVADPLCGFDASVGVWLALFDAIRFGADRRNWNGLPRDMPFNLVAGGADPSSLHGKAIRALGEQLAQHGLSNVTVSIYPDTRHEGLKELNRSEIMADFVNWLDENVAAGSFQ